MPSMNKENYMKLSLDKSHYNLIMIMTTLPLQATPMTTTVCTSTARARTPTSSTYSWTGTMWSWRRRSWFRFEIEEVLLSFKTLPHHLHLHFTGAALSEVLITTRGRLRTGILRWDIFSLCNTNNVHILSMCHPRCAIMNGLMLPPVQCWCCNQYWLLLEYLLHIFVINYLRAVTWPPLALVLITPLPCVNNDYPTL